MKMADINITEPVVEHLKAINLIRVNYDSLLVDFSKQYYDYMMFDHPPEVPEGMLQEMKSNLFTAFCFGALIAVDPASTFRQNFTLPQEVVSKIAQPNKQLLGSDGRPL
jgi:hypothetical protein